VGTVPKKKIEIETHAAHYSVAKTERWCHKLNIPVSRESFCKDENYEMEIKKGGVPAVKRANSQIRRLEKILKLKEKILKDGPIEYENKRYIISDERVCYVYCNWNDNRPSYVSCKDNSSDEFMKYIGIE
jgi:hypothetical protein